MNRSIALGMAMLGGAVIGATAVNGLHAQAKSHAYLVSEITVKDAQAYASEYAPKIRATIAKAGGHIIALGGGGGAQAGAVTALQGDAPQRVAIQEWDSMDALKAWWNSADRKAAMDIGNKYASFRVFAVEAAHLSQ